MPTFRATVWITVDFQRDPATVLASANAVEVEQTPFRMAVCSATRHMGALGIGTGIPVPIVSVHGASVKDALERLYETLSADGRADGLLPCIRRAIIKDDIERSTTRAALTFPPPGYTADEPDHPHTHKE